MITKHMFSKQSCNCNLFLFYRTNTSSVCENRGTCVCGICECNAISPSNPSQRYSGKFCECDDYSCDRFEKQLCGGMYYYLLLLSGVIIWY